MALELTEKDLAALADRSADAELGRVYPRLQQGARHGLARVLGASNIEEDDVVEVVVKALAQWLQKPLEQRTPALAYTIGMYRGMDFGGHIVRRRPGLTADGNAPGSDDDLGLDPLEAVLQQERLDAALACLEGLTEKQRAYVKDVIMHGQSESDWADQSGISQQAANKSKLGAIRRLRDCVETRLATTDREEA